MMKPFWKKPGKKKIKKQLNPVQKKNNTIEQKPKPEPWKPPVISPKAPTITEKPKQTTLSKVSAQKQTITNYEKEFRSIFGKLTSEKHRPWDIWKDLIIMAACAISNSVDKTHYNKREKQYLETINKYEKAQQDLFPELFAQIVLALDENPEQDFLGKMFMDFNFSNHELKQEFTPYPVCRLMADITIGDVAEQIKRFGFVSLNDPCCGAGATLIAGINAVRHKLEKTGLNYQNHLLVTGQDIEEVVALMCYIQISMLGVAGYIKVGNSPTEPMSTVDTTENYWFTPMYFSDIWAARMMFHNSKMLFRKGENNEK